MTASLSTLLEQEHHDIDAALEAFLEDPSRGTTRHQDLARAVSALRRHIYLEEEFLFPPLGAAGMIPPVLVMLREHGEIWRTLDTIEGLDSEADQTAVAQACTDLLELLASHNAKEEPIIYPQGDIVLSDQAQADLRSFIDSGHMPQGWSCAQA